MLFRSVLNRDHFFPLLEDKERKSILGKITITRYNRGQLIFYEGSMPFGIYMVEKGRVKLFKTGDEGKKQIFQICMPGDFFGFHAVLLNEPFPDSAETMEDCIIHFIPKQDFLEIVEKSNSLSFYLLQKMSEEFRDFIEQQTFLLQKPVRARIAFALVKLDALFQNEEGRGIIPLTRTELANLVGTAKESLVRTITDFKKEGKIRSDDGRHIEILNKKELLKCSQL